jgi:hypothetical protein
MITMASATALAAVIATTPHLNALDMELADATHRYLNAVGLQGENHQERPQAINGLRQYGNACKVMASGPALNQSE